MPYLGTREETRHWAVRRIGVVGPGIVGMPMAALLADARLAIGGPGPATVTVVQRPSPTSGWKIDAINAGRSPIGGVEPALDRIVATSVREGRLDASHDPGRLWDCDMIVIAVQTDRDGWGPAYGPLFEALEGVADALRRRPAGNVPLVVFESTLAPSSMATVISEFFAQRGLVDGRDVLLGNSPNRVMPGRLVERVRGSDKLVAGLCPITPRLIEQVYRHLVTGGTVYPTNSLTAEVVKTLENAYRDVRIAYAAELVRFCDASDIDFYALREEVNHRLEQSDGASYDGAVVPTGGLLVPTIGVGGHCLPKDGILLWWRRLEAGADPSASLILEARRINDAAPAAALRLGARAFGSWREQRVAVLGAAYRADSEDTRNSPTLVLAGLLRDAGARIRIHDPYVAPHDQNLGRLGLADAFTSDLDQALDGATRVVLGVGHQVYLESMPPRLARNGGRPAVLDGCNFFRPEVRDRLAVPYAGVGRGRGVPPADLVHLAFRGFLALERGVANEVAGLVDFLNARYAGTGFEPAEFREVRRLAGTCATGCRLVEPGPVDAPAPWDGFLPRLVHLAARVPVGAG
jgi:UDP-N-acetyl-D-mannosaminuronic acid dehydrogenase